MVISLMANIGIILLNMYIIWKLGGGFIESKNFTKLQILQFTLLESIAGILLLSQSITINETRFDFRVIIFALSMKYLGAKVTIPTIFIVTVARFFFAGETIASIAMVSILLFAMTIDSVFKWSKMHYTGRGQLLLIEYYYLFLTFPVVYLSVGNIREFILVYLLGVGIGTILTIIVESIMRDVKHLSKRGLVDNLSGLYNARKLQQDLEQLSKHRKKFALIVLDIDDFKHYNDTYGHLIGDRVIKAVCNALNNVTINKCKFYRYGGEEFVTIIEDVDGKAAYKIANQVLRDIQDINIYIENREVLTVTVSIGVAYQWWQEPLTATFNRADKALYIAKVNGKNQIVIG